MASVFVLAFLTLVGCAATAVDAAAPAHMPTTDSLQQRVAEQGRLQYEVLQRDAHLPRYGPCWKDALDQLERGCQQLTDTEQTYLALTFANCFLAKAGRKVYPCQRSQPVGECLEQVDSEAFNTFSNFFTHTQNMCFFLQSQAWREGTEETIAQLSSTSAHVAETIQASSQVQERIMAQQQDTLEYQRQIAENGSLLNKAIELSRQNVHDMLAEFKASTDEQRTLIFEIFDRVSQLQNLVLSEVSWLYTVVFYGACLFVVYLVTGTQRTADARFWLYCVLSLNVLLERLVCSLSLSDVELNENESGGAASAGDASVNTELLPATLYYRIWVVRKLSLFSCVCVTSFFAYKYVDYNKVNNRLLEDIRQQNADMKQKMEMMQVANRMSSIKTPLEGRDVLDLGETAAGTGLVTDTGMLGDDDSDDDDDDDDASTLSYNSTATDRTWIMGGNVRDDVDGLSEVEEEEGEDDADDLDGFLSALNSNENSLAADGQQGEHKLDSSPTMMPTTTPKRRPGRPKSSAKKQNGSGASPISSTYHLRLRPRTGVVNNPILDEESPNAFGKLVSQMSNISKRNSAKLQMAVKRGAIIPSKNEHVQVSLSSDEE